MEWFSSRFFKISHSGEVLGDIYCFPLPGMEAELVPFCFICLEMGPFRDRFWGYSTNSLEYKENQICLLFLSLSDDCNGTNTNLGLYFFLIGFFSDYRVSLALNCMAHTKDPLISTELNYHHFSKTFTSVL